jgi:hypothetical protein
VDIINCGQTVTAGQVGTLTADLDCSDVAVGVFLDAHSALMMNGHGIHGGSTAAIGTFAALSPPASPSVVIPFTVVGPGSVSGAFVAIQGYGPVRVENVTILDNQNGIWDKPPSGRGIVRATDVSITDSHQVGNSGGVGIYADKVMADGLTVTGSDFNGIVAKSVLGRTVTASDNGPGSPAYGLGYGILATSTIHLRGLTANDNDGVGALATRISLRDSTVTGNTGQPGDTGQPPGDYDVWAGVKPHLVNTVCGRSNSWGVCTND